MQKFWPFLFLLVPVFCVGSSVIAVYEPSWWLPKNISTFGGDVDWLFKVILAITTITFIGTQVVLVLALFKYTNTGEKATFVHNNHRLELIWTVIPAAILIFIAFYQFSTWNNIKVQQKDQPPIAEVLAGQFEWRIRYPGTDGVMHNDDDVISVNDLHVPVGEDVVISLRSRDVLHSFFLPNLRLKQDAVPGMKIPVWFQATEEGVYDLVCAELCGWGHYKMRGKLIVESREDFEKWLAEEHKNQNTFQLAEVSQ